ncbi:MAG: hypothetical protein V3U67_03980 [Gemmatimonadota bacterium]
MSERLTEMFRAALATALATLGDVSSGAGRGYRTLQAYRRGELPVTRSAADDLAGYLRKRAHELAAAAADLEAAAQQEEGNNGEEV